MMYDFERLVCEFCERWIEIFVYGRKIGYYKDRRKERDEIRQMRCSRWFPVDWRWVMWKTIAVSDDSFLYWMEIGRKRKKDWRERKDEKNKRCVGKKEGAKDQDIRIEKSKMRKMEKRLLDFRWGEPLFRDELIWRCRKKGWEKRGIEKMRCLRNDVKMSFYPLYFLFEVRNTKRLRACWRKKYRCVWMSKWMFDIDDNWCRCGWKEIEM